MERLSGRLYLREFSSKKLYLEQLSASQIGEREMKISGLLLCGLAVAKEGHEDFRMHPETRSDSTKTWPQVEETSGSLLCEMIFNIIFRILAVFYAKHSS